MPSDPTHSFESWVEPSLIECYIICPSPHSVIYSDCLCSVLPQSCGPFLSHSLSSTVILGSSLDYSEKEGICHATLNFISQLLHSYAAAPSHWILGSSGNECYSMHAAVWVRYEGRSVAQPNVGRPIIAPKYCILIINIVGASTKPSIREWIAVLHSPKELRCICVYVRLQLRYSPGCGALGLGMPRPPGLQHCEFYPKQG